MPDRSRDVCIPKQPDGWSCGTFAAANTLTIIYGLVRPVAAGVGRLAGCDLVLVPDVFTSSHVALQNNSFETHEEQMAKMSRYFVWCAIKNKLM